MAKTPTPEQAMFWLHDVLLPTLKVEQRTTKTVLEAVPADKGDYRPDPNAKSAMELVRHIAAAENRFLETVIVGKFDVNAAGIPENVKTSAEVAAWYTAQFEKNFEALTKLSGESLLRMVDFRGMFQRPAISFLQLAMSHSIHHRGQLSTYLRPMGAKVPAIYGESYDSAQAKKAAQA
ncbi:MAG TPA: DinB family protein [Methylomirabilota bacterium]|nr:DinB family protein [Methylomirabilota bacterium]